MRRTQRMTGAILGIGIAAMAVALTTAGQTATQALGLAGGAAYGAPSPHIEQAVKPQRAFAAMPLAFVQNRGQTAARVRYYAVGNHYAFFATKDELMLSLTKDKPARSLALGLRFIARNARVSIVGAKSAPGKVNYLTGTDPAAWHTNLARYQEIVYRGLWPRIDLRLHERAGVLKYEFHLHPGARLSDIKLAYAGAHNLTIARTGALQIKTGLGLLRDAPPVSYQLISGKRVSVHSRYVVTSGSAKSKAPRFAFAVDGYVPGRDLIIDPGIQFTTFLGGNSHEVGAGIAVDASGNSYIGGTTQSPNFPTTTGAFRRTGAAGNFSDAFVTKLNPAGTALIYSTFVGGSDLDLANGIAIDGSGNAYVTGTTEVLEFPHDRRRLRPESQHPAQLPALRDRQHRRLRLQTERERVCALLFHLPRRHRHRFTARRRG